MAMTTQYSIKTKEQKMHLGVTLRLFSHMYFTVGRVGRFVGEQNTEVSD